MIDPFTQRRTN